VCVSGRTAETGLCGVVAEELKAFGFVLDDIGGDGWVVGDLLDEKRGATGVVVVVVVAGAWPIAIEKSKNRNHHGLCQK